MNILVLQHVRCEHPGVFRRFFDEDGHTWQAVHLDEGESLPPVDSFGQEWDALWVMGGPMDVWQEDAHPWLVDEKAFIREAVVERGVPFLGLCLGHQLLAEAAGGEVGPANTPEIGVMPVNLTIDGVDSVFLDGLDEQIACLQWHSAEVTVPPPGATVLATTAACPVQAMSVGPRAFSAQFHIEVEPDTVSNWAAIPEYAAALTDALGSDGVTVMQRDCEANMAS